MYVKKSIYKTNIYCILIQFCDCALVQPFCNILAFGGRNITNIAAVLSHLYLEVLCIIVQLQKECIVEV